MQGAGRQGWFGREGSIWETLAWWRAGLLQEDWPPLGDWLGGDGNQTPWWERGHVPVGSSGWKERDLRGWTCVAAVCPFPGLSSSSMALSIRDLPGMDSFGGVCLQGDFSFSFLILYFLPLPW